MANPAPFSALSAASTSPTLTAQLMMRRAASFTPAWGAMISR
jgi:hypothetical protein